MIDSQMAIARSQSIHHSLFELFNNLYNELEEKDNSIQEAIKDKMKFVEMMSNMEYNSKVFPSTTNSTNSTTSSSNITSSSNNQEKLNLLKNNQNEIKDEIILKGNIKTLVGLKDEWKKCYFFLFKSKIICLNQEMEPVIIIYFIFSNTT